MSEIKYLRVTLPLETSKEMQALVVIDNILNGEGEMTCFSDLDDDARGRILQYLSAKYWEVEV